ncbi:hypothetical protein ATO11_08475 [Pseudaestuariivita atlantica]|uniref:phosphoglycolate phosphatase n=1 Tax=Pseudaestuariivita atlantica TaxID=1317121 RepID=A0A0L1JRU0_9RHOB|nr:hypothetical protein ATO11_08475 [Pseudaestuariivita atlantica]
MQGIIFDKDGTLLDFHGTWSAFAAATIGTFAGPDPDARAALAAVWEFDLATGRFADTSPAVAGTNRELAELAAGVLPDTTPDLLEGRLAEAVTEAPVVGVLPLRPVLGRLASGGLKLGIMTNDAETAARAHMQALDVGDMFAAVLGSDSGAGAKPSGAPLREAARRMGVTPDRCAMVGDSTHDLRAGRDAGMVTIAVLTGTADAETLAPWADLVLPSVADLPDALGVPA